MIREIVKRREWVVLTPQDDDPGAEGQFIFEFQYPVRAMNPVRAQYLRRRLGLNGEEAKPFDPDEKKEVANELWQKGKITRREILDIGGRIIKNKK